MAPTKVQSRPEGLVGPVEILTPWDSASIETADTAITSGRVRIEDILRYGTEEHGDNRDHCTQVGKIPDHVVRPAVPNM